MVVVVTSVCCPSPDRPSSTTQLCEGQQDVDNMRTLTIGDRTISYDAGLDSLQPGPKSGEATAQSDFTPYRQAVVCIMSPVSSLKSGLDRMSVY